MFLYIVAFVILCVMVLNHGSRISKLEKTMQNSLVKNSAPNNTVPKSSSVTTASPVSAQSAQPLSTSPLNTVNNVSVSNSQGVTKNVKEHDEEASGRLLAKIGIGAVLVGVAFFLNYAFENGWVGDAGKVMIGILFGVAFLVLGQVLRKKYLNYSDVLMGGGIAILYLSFYAAQNFYHLIGVLPAGIFMFCVTALAFVISIVNATMALALIAVIGGYATPFMVGDGTNNMLGLFGYITILNLGTLGVSAFKKWPKLVLASFIGTVLLFAGWFDQFYVEKDALAVTFIFLLVSFLIFILASVIRSLIAKIKADPADYILLGINAFCFAIMSYLLFERSYYSVLGFGSVLIALIYMAFAFMANKLNPEDKALNIFLPGLAVVFLSIAVPLQLSGPWIAVAWFVESLVLYFIASHIQNRGFQVMGIVVYILGLLNFFGWNSNWYDGYGLTSYGIYSGYITQNSYTQAVLPEFKAFVPIFNIAFGVVLLSVIVAYVIAYMYKKYGSTTVEIQKRGIAVFVVVANILSIYALSTQINFYYNSKQVELARSYNESQKSADMYNTNYYNSPVYTKLSQEHYAKISSLENTSNTLVSVLWALYAAMLTGIGFARRITGIRRFGLILFVITGIKIVLDVWSLGQIYRIVSFIVFGIIALAASFVYAKYKDRLKDKI